MNWFALSNLKLLLGVAVRVVDVAPVGIGYQASVYAFGNGIPLCHLVNVSRWSYGADTCVSSNLHLAPRQVRGGIARPISLRWRNARG